MVARASLGREFVSRSLPMAQGCLWDSVSACPPSQAAAFPRNIAGHVFFVAAGCVRHAGEAVPLNGLPGLLMKAFHFRVCAVCTAGRFLQSWAGHALLSLALSRVLPCPPPSPPIGQVSQNPSVSLWFPLTEALAARLPESPFPEARISVLLSSWLVREPRAVSELQGPDWGWRLAVLWNCKVSV